MRVLIYITIALFFSACQRDCPCKEKEIYYWKMYSSMTPINDREDTPYEINKNVNYSKEELPILLDILDEMAVVYIVTKDSYVYVAKGSVSDYYNMAYINEKLREQVKKNR